MTELLYISAPDETATEVTIESAHVDTKGPYLVLDRTPFYPQGGGQPSDTGSIEAEGFTFEVSKVVFADGEVRHYGVVHGEPTPGRAMARIDETRRQLHARLHTAGHLVMTAMFEQSSLRAVKGYHFPDGAYVEFDGVIEDEEREDAIEALNARLAEMVAIDEPISVESTTVAELLASGVFIPTELPPDKPTRVVSTFGYRSPCGGTHVESTGELGGLAVKRIKTKSGRARVAYRLDHA